MLGRIRFLDGKLLLELRMRINHPLAGNEAGTVCVVKLSVCIEYTPVQTS